MTLRQQIEATLEPNQFLQVVPAVGSVNRTNPRNWNAQIVTEDGAIITRKGTYGVTPEPALQNLANMLGIVPEMEVRVDPIGILRDIQKKAAVFAVLIFLAGALFGGSVIAHYDQKIVDGYSQEAK